MGVKNLKNFDVFYEWPPNVHRLYGNRLKEVTYFCQKKKTGWKDEIQVIDLMQLVFFRFFFV